MTILTALVSIYIVSTIGSWIVAAIYLYHCHNTNAAAAEYREAAKTYQQGVIDCKRTLELYVARLEALVSK